MESRTEPGINGARSSRETVHIRETDGTGEVTVQRIFPGITLLCSTLRLERWTPRELPSSGLLEISHCLEGRMEMGRACGGTCCMEQGEIRFNTREGDAGPVLFPLGYYRGMTLRIDMYTAPESLRRELPSFSFDLEKLYRRFCGTTGTCVLHRQPALERLFGELYAMDSRAPQDCFRVKVMELLLCLELMELRPYQVEKTYFPVAQVEKIHRIHDLITRDLTATYTAPELADRFGIGMTAMKSCFRSTYGQPISTYLRHYRIRRAAALLVEQPGLRTAEIGEMIGYGSASKFTAVFHEIMGVTPLEYRKAHRPDPRS